MLCLFVSLLEENKRTRWWYRIQKGPPSLKGGKGGYFPNRTKSFEYLRAWLTLNCMNCMAGWWVCVWRTLCMYGRPKGRNRG